jgi:hypothetical protein
MPGAAISKCGNEGRWTVTSRPWRGFCSRHVLRWAEPSPGRARSMSDSDGHGVQELARQASASDVVRRPTRTGRARRARSMAAGHRRGLSGPGALAAPAARLGQQTCSRHHERDGQEVGATDHGDGAGVCDVLHHDIPHFVIGTLRARVREAGWPSGPGGAWRPNGLRQPSGPVRRGARVHAESCDVSRARCRPSVGSARRLGRNGSVIARRAQSRLAPCTVSLITYNRVVAVM